MKILFIDTSLKDVSIATYESSKLLSVISECIPNMHSIYTIPYIDRCLTESKIDKKEVEKIIVINGPGSFTGIRIGLTIAKVYSYILNINVVCVSSLKALALSTSGEIIISVLNARNDNYYVGIYDKYYNNLDKECFMNKEELISLISKYDCVKLVSNEEINIDGYIVNTVKLNILNIINYYKDDVGVNNFLVKPNYLKKPEAEEKKENDKRNK